MNVAIQAVNMKTSVIQVFSNDLEADVNWTIISFGNEKKTTVQQTQNV